MKKKNNNNYISINKFLRIYYGVTDENLLTGNITHKALKQLIPELKRLPFDYSYKNQNLIASGNIVLVIDCNGNVIPYETPQAVEDIGEIETLSTETASKEEKAIEEVVAVDNLSLYELSELCKKYSKDHKLKEYRFTYRLLKAKKQKNDKTRKYKMRGYEDDKYKRR